MNVAEHFKLLVEISYDERNAKQMAGLQNRLWDDLFCSRIQTLDLHVTRGFALSLESQSLSVHGSISFFSLLCHFYGRIIFHHTHVCVRVCMHIHTHTPHFLYSSISGYLGSFHVLAIVK